MGDVAFARLCDRMGLDAALFDDEPGRDRLTILRHTLMNPYLLDGENGISYIDRYFDYLTARVRVLLG